MSQQYANISVRALDRRPSESPAFLLTLQEPKDIQNDTARVIYLEEGDRAILAAKLEEHASDGHQSLAFSQPEVDELDATYTAKLEKTWNEVSRLELLFQANEESGSDVSVAANMHLRPRIAALKAQCKVYTRILNEVRGS